MVTWHFTYVCIHAASTQVKHRAFPVVWMALMLSQSVPTTKTKHYPHILVLHYLKFYLIGIIDYFLFCFFYSYSVCEIHLYSYTCQQFTSFPCCVVFCGVNMPQHIYSTLVDILTAYGLEYFEGCHHEHFCVCPWVDRRVRFSWLYPPE